MISEKTDVIATVCQALGRGDVEIARSMARERYPFIPEPIIARQYGPLESTRVFLRDGFIDRYGGDRLIYPPVLRIVSQMLPEEFPYHPNWKTNLTHSSYWEVAATVDHLIPVTRGGPDDESNWMTTSMVRNSAKMNWTLDQLGWTLRPPGDLTVWDGMFYWFLDYTDKHPRMLQSGNVRQWHRAAKQAAG